MQRSVRTAVILIVTALVLLGIKIAVSVAHHPSDEALIQQAVTDSLDASRKGQPGGVLDLLSKKLTVNQLGVSDTSQIVEVIKNSRPDVTLGNRNVLVTGDEARIVTPVDLGLLGQTFHMDEVTLIFHKEEGRGFLFIPTPKWRLSEIRLPENQVPNLSG
jgi:hypothetical protein